MPVASFSLPEKLIQSIRNAVDLDRKAESYSKLVEEAIQAYLHPVIQNTQSLKTQNSNIIYVGEKVFHVKNR